MLAILHSQIPPARDLSEYYASVVTEDTFLVSDRLTKRRGTTPISEDAAILVSASRPSSWWNDNDISVDMYMALIGRGASHAMIEQFSMEFSDEEGIGTLFALLMIVVLLFLCAFHLSTT